MFVRSSSYSIGEGHREIESKRERERESENMVVYLILFKGNASHYSTILPEHTLRKLLEFNWVK